MAFPSGWPRFAANALDADRRIVEMNSALRFAKYVMAVAMVVAFAAGCNDSGSSSDGTPASTFTGGSDALDGRYVGKVSDGSQELGLVMKVDQNHNLVYGPIEIGDLTGRFDGSFSGTAIQFQSDVTNGVQKGTYDFDGQITDGGDTLSGTFNAVVAGKSSAGSWSAHR
jgi:hypothetical protein